MKLTLDHTQRLNLHALMGAQRASLDELRMLWRLQDRIDLTADEKTAINYRVTPVAAGGVQTTWDLTKTLPTAQYEFNEQESAKIMKVLKEWQPGYQIGADRSWLEPLLTQIESLPPDKVDGKASAGLGQLSRNN
jgi:hypothetical protein